MSSASGKVLSKIKDKGFMESGNGSIDPVNFFTDLIQNIANEALSVIIPLSMLGFVYLMFQLLFANGDSEKITKVRMGVLYLFLGFLISIMAVMIVGMMTSLPTEILGGGDSEGGSSVISPSRESIVDLETEEEHSGNSWSWEPSPEQIKEREDADLLEIDAILEGLDN
jgi:hypothetical protein